MELLSGENYEKVIHQNSIEILAKKLRRAKDEVALIYTTVLNDLQKGARIRTFLHIFVSKKVKELIG
ncbi:MAG: hypothetical protein ABSD50_15300 [Smithella sp.]|jgi:hypothetical protein